MSERNGESTNSGLRPYSLRRIGVAGGFFAAVLSMVVAASPYAHGQIEAQILVKAVAEVDGSKPEIVLGDLIEASGLADKSLAELKTVRLADTPMPGESRSFTGLALEQIFRPYVRRIEGQVALKISLRIPSRVTIVRKTMRLKQDDIEAAIKKQLKTFCADCEFDITGLSMPIIPTAVADGGKWSVRVINDMPKGSFSLPLEVLNEDSSKRVYWLTGMLAVRKKVPVLSRAMMSGERIQAEDVTMQLRDITYSTDTAATSAELAGSVCARSLPAGQIVWRSGLRREMAIRSGDGVKVIAGSDGWQVSIDGVAETSGYIGDLIRVKVPHTQKTISGILKDKGVVEVQ